MVINQLSIYEAKSPLFSNKNCNILPFGHVKIIILNKSEAQIYAIVRDILWKNHLVSVQDISLMFLPNKRMPQWPSNKPSQLEAEEPFHLRYPASWIIPTVKFSLLMPSAQLIPPTLRH